jgi:flagellar biosynthesis protein FliR
MLQELLPAEVFVYFLVFTRVGAALAVMPGFGETYVSPRIRLLIALTMTVVLGPVLESSLPPPPAQPISLVLLVGGEMTIGFFIGGIARVIISGLATAGTILGFYAGFANALLFNPLLSDTGGLPAVFLSILGMLLIFLTDTHHIMLMGVADSYTLFVPGTVPEFGDLADTFAKFVAQSFLLGFQIAMPFLFVGILFYVGLGLLARLNPQVPIFFVALPVQIWIGLLVMLITFPAGLLWFLNYFESNMGRFLAPV